MENTITYTPTAIIREYLQEINALQKVNRTVKVRGIIKNVSRASGYGLANLTDSGTGEIISLFFSAGKGNADLFEQLEEGMETALTGNLSVYSNSGYVRLSMTPICMDGETVSYRSVRQDMDTFMELLQKKREKGYKNIYNAFQQALEDGRKPRIVLVRPKTETVQEDIRQGLSTIKDQVSIESYPCDFKNPNEVARALQDADRTGADMVILSRGGGEALGVMDDNTILQQLVKMEKPIIVGLGHGKDKLKADVLADRACGLPYEIGAVIKEVYNERGEANRYKYLYNDTLKKLNEERNNNYIKWKKGGNKFYGIWGTDYFIVKCIIVGLMVLGLLYIVKL